MTRHTEDQVYQIGAMPRVLYNMERDENPGLQAAEVAGKADRWANFVEERFAKFFNPRIRRLDPPAAGSEMIQKFHDICDEMPEPKSLEARTAGDEVLSGMAAASICRTIATRVAATQQKPRRDIEKLKQRVRGLEAMKDNGAPVADRLSAAQDQLAKAVAENQGITAGLDPVTIRAAIREAVEQAENEISDLQDGMQAFSYGSAPGAPVRIPAEKMREMAGRLKRSPSLQRIAKLAGRLRQEAAQKQREKTDTQCSEISNVELGRDLCRLLPSELAAFADDGLELDFYRRYSEGRLLQYKLEGHDTKTKGPIVFALDESGSMEGAPDERAKAVAMAMLEIAQRQRRGWALIHFSGSVGRIDYCEPGKVKPDELMDAMMHFEDGGTNFEAALDAAVELIEAKGGMEKADVIMVTDGICNTAEHWNKGFVDKKRALKFNLYSVLVNVSARGSLEKISDRVFNFSDLLKDEFKGKAFRI